MAKDSVGRVLDGNNPGAVLERDHGAWYRALFAPSVSAGIAGAADLAGYRSGQVYIRRSKHVPLWDTYGALPDLTFRIQASMAPARPAHALCGTEDSILQEFRRRPRSCAGVAFAASPWWRRRRAKKRLPPSPQVGFPDLDLRDLLGRETHRPTSPRWVSMAGWRIRVVRRERLSGHFRRNAEYGEQLLYRLLKMGGPGAVRRRAAVLSAEKRR